MRRVNYVAREYHRGRDGVLRREGEKGSQKAEDEAGAAAGWADFFDGFDAHNGGGGGLEWLLLEVPSASARERGSDQLAKVGLVTEETLFLPLGKNIKWRKFYKEPVFGSGEPTWKGVGGGKYKWQKEKDSEECYTVHSLCSASGGPPADFAFDSSSTTRPKRPSSLCSNGRANRASSVSRSIVQRD